MYRIFGRLCVPGRHCSKSKLSTQMPAAPTRAFDAHWESQPKVHTDLKTMVNRQPAATAAWRVVSGAGWRAVLISEFSARELGSEKRKAKSVKP